MNISFKILLPVIMGSLSATLMVWDLHNQRVISSMGMAWDTGAPLWPFQTPDTLLFAINTPAFLVSGAGKTYLKFGWIGPMRYATFFPAILALWSLIGLYLDRRHAARQMRASLGRALLFGLLGLALISLGVEESRWAFGWWWTYSRTLWSVSDLILLRLLAPSVWCLVLGAASLASGRRRIHLRVSTSN